jgi:ribosomal-protein-serine acetyltransferase
MFHLRIDDHLELRPLRTEDADVLIALVQRNRDHLDPWLRWSGRVQTVDDARAHIERFAAKTAGGDGFFAGLWLDGELVGGVVCHGIDRASSHTEIGYWLGAEYVGRGLVTRACRAVIAALFEQEKLHRIEIQAAVDNLPSRAVAERLGFTFELVARDSAWITTQFRDHAIYSLLDREWHAQ